MFQDIELSVQMATKSQLKLSDILRKEYVKPMLVSLGLMFFQQFSGINAVMFYSVRVRIFFDGPIQAGLFLFFVFSK